MKINAAYLRVSSQQGSPSSKQEESLPRQEQLITTWVKSLNFPEPFKIFRDDKSGSLEHRDEFDKLKHLIEKNEVCRVFLYDDSRLARDQETVQKMVWFCLQHGVEIWVYSLRRRLDLTQESDRILLGINGLINEYFLINQRRMFKDGADGLIAKGGWMGRHPYGYTRGEDKHLKPIPEEFQIVQRIFSEVKEHSVRAICQKLEADRLTGKIPAFRGNKPWSVAMVCQILRNPVYTGSVAWNRTKNLKRVPRDQWRIIKDAHPGVVSWEEFEKIEDIFKLRNRGWAIFKPSLKNPYAGLILCGHHEKNMIGLRRGGKEYFLFCPVYCCPNNGTPVSKIESKILDQCRELIGNGASEIELKRIREKEEEISDKKNKIKQIKSKLPKFQGKRQKYIYQMSKDEITKTAFDREIKAVGEEIKLFSKQESDLSLNLDKIQMELDGMKRRMKPLEVLNLPFAEIPYEQKREVLRKLIKCVSVFERKNVKIQYETEVAI